MQDEAMMHTLLSLHHCHMPTVTAKIGTEHYARIKIIFAASALEHASHWPEPAPRYENAGENDALAHFSRASSHTIILGA